MSSQQRKSGPTAALGVVSWIWVLVLVVAAARLEAGSVFMKNGYILQGPVVDRSDEAVVLGWTNGKVRIYRRFIQSVVYDAGEEQQLEELARLREEEARAAEEALAEEAFQLEEDELPVDVDVLLRMYEAEAAGTGPIPGDGEPDAVEPGSGGDEDPGTPVVSVQQLPGVEQLGERVSDFQAGFSLRPPQGWSVREDKEAFQVLGPAREDGWTPSLNLVALPRGELSWEDCVQALRDGQTELLEGTEVLAEGDRQLGDVVGFELFSRGALQGRELLVRQVLLPIEDTLWLFSSFAPADPEDELVSVLDKSLETVDFTTE
jgi:hypothetical protein